MKMGEYKASVAVLVVLVCLGMAMADNQENKPPETCPNAKANTCCSICQCCGTGTTACLGAAHLFYFPPVISLQPTIISFDPRCTTTTTSTSTSTTGSCPCKV
ncbi:hypothetical protein SUGI_0477890 [Cryptomeria japonica]|nr:hypothetical protein SUGI_0477890 [Cryptomeria japonica]